MYYFDDKWGSGVGQAIWLPTAGHNSLFFKGLPLRVRSGGTTVATRRSTRTGRPHARAPRCKVRQTTDYKGDRTARWRQVWHVEKPRVFAKATSFIRRRQVFRPPFRQLPRWLLGSQTSAHGERSRQMLRGGARRAHGTLQCRRTVSNCQTNLATGLPATAGKPRNGLACTDRFVDRRTGGDLRGSVYQIVN